MHLQRTAPVSLAQQLEELLKNQIADGTFLSGTLLPSEQELIKSHAVSRTTVRTAIQRLCQEGFAYTIHGKGTFVSSERITDHLPSITSFFYDAAQRGMRPSHQVLRLETTTADNATSAILQIASGAPVIHLDRLMLANDEPVSLCYTYIPIAVVAPMQHLLHVEALERESLYDILRQAGIELDGGQQTISAVAATPEQAAHLRVAPGSALIDCERITHSHTQGRVEFTRILSRPDRTQWKVQLSAPDWK